MFNYKEREPINDTEIKKILKERDNRNLDEVLVIENKVVYSFYNVNCKNICFRDCLFNPSENDNFFTNSYIENITIENCMWYDCYPANTYFKNIKIINTVIDNNIWFLDCIFDNLKYKNSIMNMFGLYNCTIKNTDFTGQEHFFLQTTSAETFEKYDVKLFNNFEAILKQNKDKLVIPWYTMQFDNCKIDIDSIKKLLEYSDRIDPNYFWMGQAYCKTGYIHLNGAKDATKYNLLCNLFLYDIDQTYEYLGEIKDEKERNYVNNLRRKFFPIQNFDNMDISKYSKRLTTKPKKIPMTIVDNNGNIIDTSLIIPIGEIFFENTYKSSNSNYIDSNYDANNLEEKIGTKIIGSKLWN